MASIRLTLITLFAIFVIHNSTAQISGEISINAEGTGDYPGIQQVFDALSNQGISGPVTIRLQPGTYKGIIETGEIQGTSPINRITLTSSTNNAEDVQLTATLNQDGEFFFFNVGHIKIRYTDYLTFRNLTIITTTTENPLASAFTFFGGTQYLEIKDCKIIMPELSSFGLFAPKYTDNDFEFSELGPDFLTIDNNYIEGNINFSGNSPDFRTKNLRLSNNHFRTQFMTISDNDGVYFLNNRVESASDGGNTLSLFNAYGENIISGNYFNTTYTSINASFIQTGLKIYNNFIISENVGINIESNHVECYYNNFYIHGPVSGKTAIQIGSGANNIIKNNIFNISGNGAGVSFFNDPSEDENIFDYNNYYAPEGSLWQNTIAFPTQYFTQLSELQQQFQSELHGMNVNPAYNSATDLHVNNNALKGAAQVIPGIERDYDGDLRDPLTPDIGADELLFPPNLAIDTVYISPLYIKGKEKVTISWTAVNNGGSNLDQNWKDYIYLSLDQQLDENDIKLGEWIHSTPLAMGERYTASFETDFEKGEDGIFYFLVLINAENDPGENPIDNLKSSQALEYKTKDRPSLYIPEINLPNEIASGTEINISWVVTNNGNLPTSAQWEDFVYVSSDSSSLVNPDESNPNLSLIAKVKNVTGLGIGESYSSSRRYFVPIKGSGKLYFKVIPDGNNTVDESTENPALKSVISNPLNVFQVPLADLIITRVDVPTTAFSGDLIDLSYTIKNIGNAPTTFDRRLDHIYLMNDSVENDDNPGNYIRFEELYITGELLPDSSVIIQTPFRLPFCQAGTFFFFLHTDARQIVFEFNDDNNGFRSSDIEIVLKPSPDFIIENIGISPLVPISGNRFNLFYNVKNIGFDTASILNNLFEGIWLTRDAELNEKTAILTSKPMDIDTSTFAVGDIKPRNRLMQLPDSVFGEFYIFIKADNGNKFCELPFEDNNLARFGPFQVSMSPPKDLQITQTEVPASAEAGTQVTIGYRLENKAGGSIPLTEIRDSIALFNDSDTIHLYSYKKERTLAGNSFVNEALILTIPYKTPPGNYKMAFFTDTENRVYEHEAEDNNFTIVPSIAITRNPDNLPELAISNVSITNLSAGDTLRISYKVTNLSRAETDAAFWTDKLIISNNFNREVLSKISLIKQKLARNESYTKTMDVFVPVKLSGAFTLRLVTDFDNDVQEYDDENNVFQENILIELSKWADLAASELSYPETLTAGQEARFTWKVQNQGTRETERGFWIDRVYLSEDKTFNRSDITILKKPRNEKLLIGGSYIADTSFRIPAHLSGNYYIILVSDDMDEIFENGDENNNIIISSAQVTINRLAPVDLRPVITDITYGGTNILYEIYNQGTNPVTGSWIDAFFLSKDMVLDKEDKLIGYHTVTPPEDILPGGKLEQLYFNRLPVVRPDNYYLLVKADVFNYIPETNISNNVSNSMEAVYIDDIADLENGVPVDSIFRHYSRNHYYQLEKPSDKGILLTLNATGTSPITDLYYRTDDIPVAGGIFDYRGNNPLQTDQRIIVPSVDSITTDFILAEIDYLDGDFVNYTILAEEKDFSILDVQPRRGGNHGTVVLDLEGFDFTDSITILLRNEIQEIEAVHSYSLNSSLARAHLNLNDLSPGLYDVVLKRNDRGGEAVMENIFAVEDTSYRQLYVDVITPGSVRINREASVQVNYVNYGNINDYDISLYISFYRSGFRADSFEVTYLGDGITNRLPGEASLYHGLGKEVFINDGKAQHFVSWLPVFAANGRGQHSFKIKGSTEDTIYIAATYFRNDITKIHFSGNLDDLRYTQFFRDFERYLTGSIVEESNGKKASQNECILDPKIVEAMIWKGVRAHAEYVSGGIPGNPTQVVTTVIQEGLKAYVDPEAHLKSEDLIDDFTDERRKIQLDPTKKSSYDQLIQNLDNCLTPDILQEVKDRCLKIYTEPYRRANGTMGTNSFTQNNCPRGQENNNSGGGGGGGRGILEILFPKDPNDIIGPEGSGSQRFIDRNELLPYKIRFENVSTATAPALRVDINNELEENFDIRRFRLNQIGWGDTVIQLPEKSYFSGEFDLGPEYKNHRLKLVAGIDPLNSRAFWNFSTIDPETGASPDDVDAGFLPPNDSTGIGEGFVSYFIKASTNALPGDVLNNDAVIVFDEEESLATNIWMNTISGDGTESFVLELPEITDTTRFIVKWDYVSLTDFSPVPASYSIFVSVNGTPYTKWFDKTTETSAIFTGTRGDTYYFFSIAEFSDGSFESAPPVEDARTTISEASTFVSPSVIIKPGLSVYPNPSSRELNIHYSLLNDGHHSIEIFDLTGKKIYTLVQDDKPAGEYFIELENTGFLQEGVYFIRLENGEYRNVVKWVRK